MNKHSKYHPLVLLLLCAFVGFVGLYIIPRGTEIAKKIVPADVTLSVVKDPLAVKPKATRAPSPVPQIIAKVFGKYASQAQIVSLCMSGNNPMYTNRLGGMGLFGLRPTTWASSPYNKKSPFDAEANTLAAYWLFVQSGYMWYRWGTCAP